MQYLKIKDLNELDRPREKLIEKGAAALSDAELLGILISSGVKNMSAVLLAQHILNHYNNDLSELAKLSIKELQKFKGIGKARAVTIAGALELGRRRRADAINKRVMIDSSQSAYEFIYPNLSDKTAEEFWIILLNKSSYVIKKCLISVGGLTSTAADPKIIFKIALENNAACILLAHNHPSGNSSPSEDDIKMTNKLIEAAKLLDITIMDHLILGNENYFSFADEALL
jgi:DNA repair protein RadC